jgi:fumarylacetoacetate (FAA) hydrolase
MEFVTAFGENKLKLASLKTGGRDGTLIVVNRALTQYVVADEVAATMQQAIEDWSNAAPRLNAISAALNAGECDDARELDCSALASPFPRA